MKIDQKKRQYTLTNFMLCRWEMYLNVFTIGDGSLTCFTTRRVSSSSSTCSNRAVIPTMKAAKHCFWKRAKAIFRQEIWQNYHPTKFSFKYSCTQAVKFLYAWQIISTDISWQKKLNGKSKQQLQLRCHSWRCKVFQCGFYLVPINYAA